MLHATAAIQVASSIRCARSSASGSSAIALGYEDVNDHDTLRFDPVLALFSERLEAKRKDCAPLAGKSTINRLEHAPAGDGDRYHKIGHDAKALEDVSSSTCSWTPMPRRRARS